MYKEKLKDYESPTIDVLYLKFEGVVCQSGTMTIPDWQNDGNELDF